MLLPTTAWSERVGGTTPVAPAMVSETVERRPVLMGTTARIVVTAPSRSEALAATVAIEEILRAAESELSTWKTGTELDRLNRTQVGQRLEVSASVDQELRRALACAETTQGAFDPTVGSLIRAWDLRGEGRHPTADELEAALRLSGWRHLDRRDGSWERQRDVVVEEGGFGKGAALDRVATWLVDESGAAASLGRTLVDLGGQLLLFDPEPHREPSSHSPEDVPEPWRIEVSDPDDRATPLLRLEVPAGSLATSGNSERATGDGDDRVGHLLDPRTGRPAVDFGSITVWAPTALEADCLATALFVMGPEDALTFAERTPGVEVLVIERGDGSPTVRASRGFGGRVELLSDRIVLAATANPGSGPKTWTASALDRGTDLDLRSYGSSDTLLSADDIALGTGPRREPWARADGSNLDLHNPWEFPRGEGNP